MGGRAASTMPLLSTLAALVILASSEEQLPDTSPRLSEPGAPGYDQSWRAVDIQPAVLQPEPGEEWGVEIAPLESPKRRRPGRKRKRRPQTGAQPADDLAPEEHRPYYADGRGLDQEEPPSPSDIPEPPRRRRKRPDGRNPNRWTDEPHEQRPLRRRGHRRKQRPLTADADQNDRVRIQEDVSTLPQEQPAEQEQTYRNEPPDEGRVYLDEANNDQITMDDLIAEPKEEGKPKEENSESSMSLVETPGPRHADIQQTPGDKAATEDKRDKSYRVPYSLARKGQEQAADGTSKIKELLKQSGGLSLSELLQQRNLSLSDLLSGKQNAISALKSDSIAIPEEDVYREGSGSNQKIDHIQTEEKLNIREPDFGDETNFAARKNTETATEESDLSIKPLPRRLPPVKSYKNKDVSQEESQANIKENHPTESPRRRLPLAGYRRNMRQRIKNPQMESTTLRIRPHYNFRSGYLKRENITTTERSPSQEIENVIDPEFTSTSTKKSDDDTTTMTNNEITTTTDETTTLTITTTSEPQTEISEIENIKENETAKPKLIIPALRPKLLATNSELRRQALNNRQRKKKLRNKAVIPKNAEEISVQDLFGVANLVSASEFITKIQTTPPPTSTTTENDLPDLFTVESTNIEYENTVADKVQETFMRDPVKTIEIKLPKYTTGRHRISTTTVRSLPPTVTTEEGAKEEILEVFKDMQGGARLAKILSERNMTINELVEHRERGSSQIHLADIFHNASREPNPPEPFLSKSLIEPISKETYPLRALLEANLHDPPAKLPTQNLYAAQFTNIPLIVDYGKNINENRENLGIVALFNEFANSKAKYENSVKKDSEGTAYFTSVMSLNTTDDNFREGRSRFDSSKKTQAFPSILPELRSGEEKTHKIDGISTTQGTTITTGKTYSEQDIDGDGLIVLEDLQHLNELDNNIARAINEKLEVNMFEDAHSSDEHHGILGKFPSSVRSATIASASIVGLTMILFLLTYIGCKWRQRRKNLLRKESFRGERIPTPIFENRKSNRNCSTRSISPMLASSTGFTMNTLDSQTGKESPDYMWDTLHKPFQ